MKTIIFVTFMMVFPIQAETLKVALVPNGDIIGFGEIYKTKSFIGVTEFGVLYKYLGAEIETSNYVDERVLPVVDFKDLSLGEALEFIEDYVNKQKNSMERKQPAMHFRCEINALKLKKVNLNSKNATLSKTLNSLIDQIGGKLVITPFKIIIVDK
jgi:hypothetical protein